MVTISSSIKNEPCKVEITSPTGNTIIADEPEENGGKDLGFSPNELLASALAACTSATLKMYAGRKGWDLQEVKLDVTLDWVAQDNKTVINRKITLLGALDETQRARLLAIAERCPVHKILTNPIEIHSQLA